jgi:hypothetical protein
VSRAETLAEKVTAGIRLGTMLEGFTRVEAEEALAELKALAERAEEAEPSAETLAALEHWLVTEYPNRKTVREETVIRRVLWALRGSNDDPPHPDREALAASGRSPSSGETE